MKSGDEAIIAGDVLKHVARARGRDGGAAILHRVHYMTKICTKQFSTFYLICMSSFVDTKSMKFNVWVVYHPTPSCKTPGTVADVYAELENLFYDASLSATPTVVLGDFNIHYDDAKQSEPLRMLLRSFNLIQHVDVAAEQCGHTLDLVITHDDDDLLSSVTVTPDSLSDHNRGEVIPPPRTSTIRRRSFKRTDVKIHWQMT